MIQSKTLAHTGLVLLNAKVDVAMYVLAQTKEFKRPRYCVKSQRVPVPLNSFVCARTYTMLKRKEEEGQREEGQFFVYLF